MNQDECGFHAAKRKDGGAEVNITVPTSGGEVDFGITVERDEDGDWRVFVPWFDHDHEDNPARDHTDIPLENGASVTNGICCLAAPDMSVLYEPFNEDGLVGFKCTRADGAETYIYLNPSYDDDGADANVFVYEGQRRDPNYDNPQGHVKPLFDSED